MVVGGLMILYVVSSGHAEKPIRCDTVSASFSVETFLSRFEGLYEVELAEIPAEDFWTLHKYGVPQVWREATVLDSLRGPRIEALKLPVDVASSWGGYWRYGFKGVAGTEIRKSPPTPPNWPVVGCPRKQLAEIFTNEELRQRAMRFLGR